MTDMHDLAEKKAMLSRVEAEIAAETEKFEASMASLRTQCEMLRIEYLEALHAEMATVERPPPPELQSLLAAIEQTDQPILVRRLRKRAVTYLVGARPQAHSEPWLVDRGGPGAP